MNRHRFLTAAVIVSALALPGASFAAAQPTTAGAASGGSGRHPVPDPTKARLLARSILPAATYVADSERSGHWTEGVPALRPPYPGQPVQGFSATHRLADGSYLVMSDNGFGAKANSADALLAVHRVLPDLAAARSGKVGRTTYLGTPVELADPDKRIPWPIWRDGGCTAAKDLPRGYACPKPDRRLTGWDFDLESMQVAADGTFWFGEEFGPYLLHTDVTGKLLSAPVPTPGVKSPSNPTLATGERPNLPNSKGFEGMAISPDGTRLYPLLEGATEEDKAAGKANDLRMYDVRLAGSGAAATATYTGDFRRYRMERPEHAIGDFIAVNDHQFLVIERDNLAGAKAVFKRIYLVDIAGVEPGGYVVKQLLVDLMKVPDPRGVGGLGDPFAFPFVTIEDVELIDDRTIAVMNDNNFPAAGGRSETRPDQNEFLAIRLDSPLDVDGRLLAHGARSEPAHDTFAVVGDIPYGDRQVAAFPGWVDQLNAAKPNLAFHVGDIKTGSSPCTDAYNTMVRTQFGRFAMPLVYTPGDNEWTDCHRKKAGRYNPLERLAAIRAAFFTVPGRPLGANRFPMVSDAAAGFPENVRFWRPSRVEFAAIHVVGSNNDRAPWAGRGLTAATPEQLAEEKARMASAISVVKAAFAEARANHKRAVAIFQQADMFDPTYVPKDQDIDAFTPLVQTLIDEAARFPGQTYLFDGDSHRFIVDKPLAAGSGWLARYGVRGAADRLTRVTVDGDVNATSWLKVTVSRPDSPDALVLESVPFAQFAGRGGSVAAR